MNPSKAYWDARTQLLASIKSGFATAADIANVDRLNDARIVFERHMSVTQFATMCAESGIDCPSIESQQAVVDAEAA